MNSTAGTGDHHNERLSMTALGLRLRAERLNHQLSLDELATLCEVSRSMLSAIERGTKVPTVLVLDRIAGALGISVSRLLVEERRDRVVHLPVEAQESLQDASGWRRRIVSPVLAGIDFELGRLEFDPRADAGEFGAHLSGWTEYVTVESGSLEIVLNRVAVHLLNAGDSLYYESDVVHSFRNPGTEPTIAYIAMSGDHRDRSHRR